MKTNSSEQALLEKASRLQRQNRLEEAITSYVELLRENPTHVGGLNRLGNCLFAIGRLHQSVPLFERACLADPASAVSHFNRGRALASLGRRDEAEGALKEALRIEPDLAMAWLHLGKLLATAGTDREAQACFQKAFDRNPNLEQLHLKKGVPSELANLVIEARRALRSRYIGLHRKVLGEFEARYPGTALERVKACVGIQHGEQPPEYSHALQRPESIFFPGLPPTPWFKREQFPWVPELEAQWQDIRSEFHALQREDPHFRPYVTAGPGVPQAMENLSGSHQWDAFHFYIGGTRQEVNCARCPRTAEALASLPLARLRGVAPEAFYSILRPGAHIRPHHGVANTKLAVHLPLLVPEGCSIRVGNEVRSWDQGKCVIFDDSFEHEAWNRGDDVRVVLIFEVWNPYLTSIEIEALTQLSSAIDEWAASCENIPDLGR